MESERFDRFARAFSQTRSRRQTLRTLAGAAAAGAFAIGGREASADLCKRDGKACKKDGQCCSKHCDNGKCQPKTPNVCSGQASSNPCFPGDGAACGTSGTGRTCHCGTDIDGKSACFDLGYCLNPRLETLCETNADCEAKGFGAGSVCFSAENCCLPDERGVARGCTAPCPLPSA
jgi:hypothetical protein